MKNTKVVGDAGEEKAAKFYVSKGYKIVERNFRTKRGEIDIIAEKGETIIFAEVKTLPGGDSEMLAHELNSVKRCKIIESAKCFLKNHRQYSNSFVRFDVVVVDMQGKEPVYLIENAFSEN